MGALIVPHLRFRGGISIVFFEGMCIHHTYVSLLPAMSSPLLYLQPGFCLICSVISVKGGFVAELRFVEDGKHVAALVVFMNHDQSLH